MSLIISGNDCIEAWRKASHEIIISCGELFNLIVEIENINIDSTWLTKYNPKTLNLKFDNINDVRNTIFPEKLRYGKNGNKLSKEDFYSLYSTINSRAMRLVRNRTVWGTYFSRLISFGPNKINQIDDIINKLNLWGQRYTTPFVVHLSSPDTDSIKVMGNPCWQFGEFLWRKNDIIDFVVVYRNHDYFQKALGNFIGLSQLLGFICEETNKTPGKLICHSIHSYFSDIGKRDFSNFIQ